ncbi:hypothetical protein Tco_1110512 [Tanacetum coccineum]|uniref:Uncharacterized protein n=1 Tax=Tanacetum coccineum TaxID=301880 RepID=A0ABQ5IJ13_9ASTR
MSVCSKDDIEFFYTWIRQHPYENAFAISIPRDSTDGPPCRREWSKSSHHAISLCRQSRFPQELLERTRIISIECRYYTEIQSSLKGIVLTPSIQVIVDSNREEIDIFPRSIFDTTRFKSDFITQSEEINVEVDDSSHLSITDFSPRTHYPEVSPYLSSIEKRTPFFDPGIIAFHIFSFSEPVVD